mgnify:FL=1
MFYKQFLKITEILNPDFVNDFDYWLATLPKKNQKNITASFVSAKFGVKYVIAESMLKYAEKEEILERYYLVKCPDCDYNLEIISEGEIAEILLKPIFCDECEEEKKITFDDIYVAYKVIKQPDVMEDEIAKAIEQRLELVGENKINFTQADSLASNEEDIYKIFYNPDESAYIELQEMKKKLDLDYGKNTTAKGNALEKLILKIFENIKGIRGTNEIKTCTNQFDCTLLCGLKPTILTIFMYLTPYFIVECKNEPENKPNNNYCNKLESILETNAAQLGIIFGRIDATSTCFQISREHYLTHKNASVQKIIIMCSDKDLKYLIDKKVNLLKYLEYKIFQVTANSPNSTFEMFEKKGRNVK